MDFILHAVVKSAVVCWVLSDAEHIVRAHEHRDMEFAVLVVPASDDPIQVSLAVAASCRLVQPVDSAVSRGGHILQATGAAQHRTNRDAPRPKVVHPSLADFHDG